MSDLLTELNKKYEYLYNNKLLSTTDYGLLRVFTIRTCSARKQFVDYEMVKDVFDALGRAKQNIKPSDYNSLGEVIKNIIDNLSVQAASQLSLSSSKSKIREN